MNRLSLISWLNQYTPLELDFKKYYDTHKAPITNQLFFEILQNDRNRVNEANARFQKIDPAQATDSSNPFFENEKTDFPESLWLFQNDDVSIRKHTRYFPPHVHTHKFIEIVYVLKGACEQTFYLENGITESSPLATGAVCIIPPKLAHSISVFDDSLVINILIRTSTMKNTLTNLVAGDLELFHFFIHTLYENETQNYIQFETGNDENIANIVIDMLLEICEDKAFSQNALLLMLGLFFTYLQRDYADTIHFSETANPGIDYIPQVLAYMQKNYATTNVQDIADHFHISSSYLSRIFKAHTNHTVIATLQRIKIDNALLLLEKSHLTVQQVSDSVGYADVTFFIRTFKKVTGKTPLQYRKETLS